MGLEKSYGVTKDRKIYGNCQVLSPEGILMFRCDTKKANWYLNRVDSSGYPLGEKISDDPLTVKLNFKPKGLGNHNREFGLTMMDNKCVSCGSEEYLTRHHVVPYCYRRYFPTNIKSHNFHDVLSLCVDCHERYERHADKLKDKISIDYDAPINGETIFNKELIKYSKIAVTLLKEDLTKIPNIRVRKLKKELKDRFGIKKLTINKIKEIADIKITILSRTHGQIVIERIDDIQSFIEMWRQHFITHNDCKHLPENWSVKNRI